MGKFTKADLKTGMFGKDETGDLFVVVGDKLIYENGLYDDIDDMSDNMDFGFGCRVDEVYDAKCFKEIRDNRHKVIWKREDEKPEVPEVPEAKPEATPGVNSVTITEDQFFEAVQKANEKFMEIGKDVPVKLPGNEVMDAMMGLQNILFGELVGCVLFNKDIK